MQTLPKLFLTGTLVLDMAMTNYCYNTYGLSPDYSFFSDNDTIEYVESVASPKKARFISNYTPVYDNIISGMAVMDDSISAGALYIEYREDLGRQLYIDGTHIQVPDSTDSIGGGLELKTDVDYAGDADAGTIYRDDTAIAAVRIKNGMFYRLSSSDESFRIGEVCVGMNIYEVCRKWGQPTYAEHPVYLYSAGERAAVTLIAGPDGYVTWMLYESTGTELIKADGVTETGTEITTEAQTTSAAAKKEDDRSYPVAEEILKQHREREAGEK